MVFDAGPVICNPLLPASPGYVTNESLFIRGYPDKSDVAPLFMGSSQRLDADTALAIIGPSSSESTLFIKFDQLSSGSTNAYILGVQGYGGGPSQIDFSLNLIGMGEGATPFTTTTTLNVLGQPSEDDISNMSLFIESGPTPTGSGTLQLFTEGANPTVANPVLDDSKINLFIRNEQSFDSSTTLFVEKDFNATETTTLFLKSNQPSGVAPLYSSGIAVTTSSSDLLIKAPEVKVTNLFSRGFN